MTYRLETGSGSQGESWDRPWASAVILGYLKAANPRKICEFGVEIPAAWCPGEEKEELNTRNDLLCLIAMGITL